MTYIAQSIYMNIPESYRNSLNIHFDNIFSEFDRRYLARKENIYTMEEDFTTTIRDVWNGKIDTAELDKLHEICERGLDGNLSAFRIYWSDLFYPVFKTNYDFERLNPSNSHIGCELYIPISILIKISEKTIDQNDNLFQKISWWKDNHTQTKLVELIKVKPDPKTLFALWKNPNPVSPP